jgi:hypothetical protein
MQQRYTSLILHVRKTDASAAQWRCVVERDRLTEVGCFADEPALAAFIEQQVGAFLAAPHQPSPDQEFVVDPL